MGELERAGGGLVPVTNMPVEFSPGLSSAFAALVFIGPRSKRWRVVKSALKRLPHMDIDGNFLALFKQTQEDLGLLVQTLIDVSGWKTAYLFINGKRADASNAYQWLSCFLSSLKSDEPETHCPDDIKCRHYRHALTKICDADHYASFIVPCKQAGCYVKFSDSIPASFEEQFKNTAVERGAVSCPNFGLFPFKGPFLHKESFPDMGFTIRLDVGGIQDAQPTQSTRPIPLPIKPKRKIKIWVKIVIALFVLAVLGAISK